ncbi:MAG: hypothetical protein ACP5XB_05635 [Isosphaeraceae bacterium]
MAATNLRAIWTAQRLYWLANKTYTTDLSTLQPPNNDFLVLPEASTQPYYSYQPASVSDNTTEFKCTAARCPSTSWVCTLSIDQTGAVQGSVTGPDGFIYKPTQSFQ